MTSAYDDNALTAQDVASLLQVSRNTVYNLVKAGALASYSVGRKMRFTARDVDAYIAHARNASTEAVAAGRVGMAPPAGQTVGSRGAGSQASMDTGVRQAASVRPFRIAGSDIAADVVANYLGQAGLSIERVYENSYQALQNMYVDGVDAAVVHLYDRKTDRFNVPFVQRVVPGTPLVVMHLVRRRQGLLVKAGNPKNVRKWTDLLRDDVVLANRERGAAARVMLDEQLVALEVGKLPLGYEQEFKSPLAAAAYVASGAADVTLGSERIYHQVDGLDFLPLANEDLDLVVAKNSRTEQPLRFLRRVLVGRGFKEELAHAVGYDTSRTGEITYEV